MICGGYYICGKLDDLTNIKIEAVVLGDVATFEDAEQVVMDFARTRYPEKDGWQNHECRLAILSDITFFKESERRKGKPL